MRKFYLGVKFIGDFFPSYTFFGFLTATLYGNDNYECKKRDCQVEVTIRLCLYDSTALAKQHHRCVALSVNDLA